MPSPFRQSVDPQAQCSKKGGVCSLQLHRQSDGNLTPVGGFVTTCPSRFWQDSSLFRWIGETVIGSSNPTIIQESKFVESLIAQNDEDDRDAVGRIDMVLLDPDNIQEWCALELQPVYFSGSGMSSHLARTRTLA